MTTMNFEDAITELLKQMDAASPRDKDLAVQQLRGAIAANDRRSLQLADPLDEEDLFDNVPV